jgi:hypothetical protein
MVQPVCPAKGISNARAAIGFSIAHREPSGRLDHILTRMSVKALPLRDGSILDIHTRNAMAVRCRISTPGG